MREVTTQLEERIRALPTETQRNLEGVSEEEIQGLEEYAGSPFPLPYQTFLRQVGRSAGDLLKGTEYSIEQRFRLRLREPAEQLLERTRASFELPKTAFVFLMSQGYQFSFFRLDQGNDPCVYHYLEGDSSPSLLDESLMNYLLRCLEYNR